MSNHHHLLSYILPSQDANIMIAILRITQSILTHDFNLGSHVTSRLQQEEDPLACGAIEISLPAEAGVDSAVDEIAIASIDHLFLPIVQRILTNAILRAEWPNEVINWQMPDFPSPGHVHSNAQRLLRKVARPQATGNEVILLNKNRVMVQRFSFGQALGIARRETKIMVGQVQNPRLISGKRQVITLTPETGRSRALVVSNSIDVSRMRGRTIAALVRPVRGRISYQVVAWSEPQRPLL